MGKQINLVQYGTNQGFSIDDEYIIYVEDDTNGAQIQYVTEHDGLPDSIIVTNTRTQIQTISSCIIPVTLAGKATGVNMLMMSEIEPTSTGCRFLYAKPGMIARAKNTTDSQLTVLTRIAEKNGQTVYSFDEVNATNNTISLTAATGDVTATFVLNKVINVFGTGDEDFNGLYTVSSSTFSGGKTVITVIQNIPAGVATSGALTVSA